MKILFAILGLLAFSKGFGQLAFEEQILNGLPTNLKGVKTAWADMENDGDLDVIITGVDNGLNTTAIYRNEGNFSFVLHQVLPSWKDVSFAWQDYNLDGRTDIVLSGSDGTFDDLGAPENGIDILIYSLVCYEQTDTGVFIEKSKFPVSKWPWENSYAKAILKWGNVDNDPFPDLIVMHENSLILESIEEVGSRITVFTNLRGSGFERTNFATPCRKLQDVLITDFNGDDINELIVSGMSIDLNNHAVTEKLLLYSLVDSQYELKGYLDVSGKIPLTQGVLNSDGEESYALNKSQENIAAFGDNYLTSSLSETIPLPEGQYTFQLFDAWGDGLGLSASVILTDNNGNVVFETEGIDHFSFQNESFCVGPEFGCFQSPLSLNITFDQYPSETFWNIVQWSEPIVQYFSINPDYSISLKEETLPVLVPHRRGDVDQDGQSDLLGLNAQGNWVWVLNQDGVWAATDELAFNSELHEITSLTSSGKQGAIFYKESGSGDSWTIVVPSALQSIYTPNSPSNLLAEVSQSEVILTWDSDDPYSYYEVQFFYNGQWQNTPTNSAETLGFWGNNNRAKIMLNESGAYQIRVRTIGMNGQVSAFSNPISVEWEGEPFLLKDIGLDQELINTLMIDIDHDGDLDIFIEGGYEDPYTRTIKIYENESFAFSMRFEFQTTYQFGDMRYSPYPSNFLDYDLDGDDDLIIAYRDDNDELVTSLFQFENWNFIRKDIDVQPADFGVISPADYDNDGDLDFIISGNVFGSDPFTKLYQNSSFNFYEVEETFVGVSENAIEWSDYDNDGDQDFLLTGLQKSGLAFSMLYTNENQSFIGSENVFEPVMNGSIEWFDFDSDGDQDVFISGYADKGILDSPIPSTSFYRNNQGTFVKESIGNWYDRGLSSSAVGDFDNDGDQDLVVLGYNEAVSNGVTLINNEMDMLVEFGGDFFTNMIGGKVSAGDLDLDGDLDVLLSGLFNLRDEESVFVQNYGVHFFENNTLNLNNSPNPPQNLNISSLANSVVEISWDASDDNETIFSGLSYHVDLFKDGILVSQYLDRAQFGNTGAINKKIFSNLLPGSYRAEVFAIDASFAKSTVSEITFEVENVISTKLTSINGYGSMTEMEFADFNNDGLWDFSGSTNGTEKLFLMINNSGILEFETEFPFEYTIDLEWVDFDNDEDLDLFISGRTDAIDYQMKLYRNDNQVFTLVETDLPTLAATFDFGDFDNDGDQDFAITGTDFLNGSGSQTAIYKNNGAGEFLIYQSLEVNYGDLEWVDFDSDGDLDLFVLGENNSQTYVNLAYRNEDGNFIKTTDVLGFSEQVDFFRLADFDSDGDMDLFISSQYPARGIYVYVNENGKYSKGQKIFNQSETFSLVDFDNNGYLDISITKINRLFLNRKSIFEASYQLLPEYGDALYLADTFVWADIDGDKDSDLFYSLGSTTGSLENLLTRPNQPPMQVSGLESTLSDDEIILSWNQGTDDSTPAEGLSYSVKFWDENGLYISAEAMPNGGRLKPGIGNAGQITSYRFAGSYIPDGVYSWAVQAIDNSSQGGPFQTGSFTMCYSFLNEDIEFTISGIRNEGSELKMSFVKPVDAVSIEFDLGDGTVVSENEYSHVYSQSGEYQITITLISNLGCERIFSTNLEIERLENQPKITNLITPNNDGLNDNLIITNARLDLQNSLKVYNSAGVMIFKAVNYKNDWGGTVEGKILPNGQYLAEFQSPSIGVNVRQVFNILRD